jgi:hypothetical protein
MEKRLQWVDSCRSNCPPSASAFLQCAPRSRQAVLGQSKSRLLGAHVGRPRSLLILPKADITPFGSVDRYGWICDGPLCDGATKNRTFVFRLDRAGSGMAVSGR